MIKLSVCWATRDEAKHIGDSIRCVKDIADELIVVDEQSTDRTAKIASNLGVRVIEEPHHPIFHITKQKAIDLAHGEWVLQMDADERVTPELAKEIKLLVNMTAEERKKHQAELPDQKLFVRHQKLLEKRDGQIGDTEGDYTAYFIPRRNFFLGKYLKYGGTYPDGVIRLFKKGKAYLPCKSVHEQYVVEGRVGWLQGHLLHMADTSFKHYLMRNNRYINLIVDEMKAKGLKIDLIISVDYLVVKPIHWFLLTQIRHKGILDGWQGVVFSFFSALRFPRAYWRYIMKHETKTN